MVLLLTTLYMPNLPTFAKLPNTKECYEMARRRHQRPTLLRSGTKDGKHDRWWFRAYVDVLGPNGVERPERSFTVGFCEEMGKRAAQSKMSEMVASLNQPALILQSQVKFGDVIDRYLKTLELREHSLRVHTSIVNGHIRSKWGELKMCEITPMEVESWIRTEAKACSKGSFSNIRAAFGAIWKAALRWGFTQAANPLSLMPKLKRFGGEEREKTLPKPDEFRQMLAELKAPYRDIVLMATGTGMRISEILAVRWSQMTGEYLEIVESRSQLGHLDDPKTTGSNRKIPIGHVRISRPAGAKDNDFVFNVTYQAALWNIKAAAKAVGIDYRGFGCHTFRRMHNTMFRRASTVDLAMKQLGHSDAATNDVYYVEDDSDVAKRAEIVERMMGVVMGGVQ